jgi:hypothetical protein
MPTDWVCPSDMLLTVKQDFYRSIMKYMHHLSTSIITSRFICENDFSASNQIHFPYISKGRMIKKGKKEIRK